MGMSVGGGSDSGDPEVLVEMNTTPLIDVMLVLLIMLIITIPIQNHSVKLNMPTGNPPAQTKEPEIIRIDIDFDGTILWNDGRSAEQVVESRAQLEGLLNGIAAIPDQPEVHLRPNKLVTYKSVAMVMATAQRLGVTKIGLVGNEQFMN